MPPYGMVTWNAHVCCWKKTQMWRHVSTNHGSTSTLPPFIRPTHNIALVDVLLGHGADITARSTWWAGGFGILEYNVTLAQAQPLIERGAPITAWRHAGLGMLDELKKIVAARPEALNERGGDGKTPLHCASSRDIIEFLVSQGADLEARDVDHASTPAVRHW